MDYSRVIDSLSAFLDTYDRGADSPAVGAAARALRGAIAEAWTPDSEHSGLAGVGLLAAREIMQSLAAMEARGDPLLLDPGDRSKLGAALRILVTSACLRG